MCFSVKFIIDMIYSLSYNYTLSSFRHEKSQIALFKGAARTMMLAAVDQPPLMEPRENSQLPHSPPRWLSQEREGDEERKTRRSS